MAASSTFATLVAQNPYDITLTGTSYTSAAGVAAWTNRYTASSTFVGPSPTSPLFYTERWSTAQSVGSVVFDSIRQASGEIWVATTLGGPMNTLWGTFSIGLDAGKVVTALPGAPTAGIYGISNVVTASTSSPQYFQMGETTIVSRDLGPNLALGTTQISSPALGRTGSVIDEVYGPSSSWRANSAATENFVGFEYAPGVTVTAQFVRVVSNHETFPSPTWRWSDFDVQVKLSGVWTTLGRAQFGANQNIYWGDFGSRLVIEGLRLYGSDAGGNNPIANGGLIIDDIFLFHGIPEPSTILLFGTGGLIVWRHVRRRKK